jgi:DNA-binding transcriptional ArsR family regulator
MSLVGKRLVNGPVIAAGREVERGEVRSDDVSRAARVLKAMANERRLSILMHLGKGELCVHELEKLIDLGQSPISQHLAVLRAAGLVTTRRRAQTVYYAVAREHLSTALNALLATFSPSR